MNIRLFEQKNSRIESFEIITLHTSGMRYSADYEIVMKGDTAEVSQYQIRHRYPENERILEKRVSVRMNFLLKSEPQRFRTSTGSFIFVRFYAAILTALMEFLFGHKNQNRIKTKSKNVK